MRLAWVAALLLAAARAGGTEAAPEAPSGGATREVLKRCGGCTFYRTAAGALQREVRTYAFSLLVLPRARLHGKGLISGAVGGRETNGSAKAFELK